MKDAAKLREIERLRACAILMVMVFHFDQARRLLPRVAQESWSGVDLFFVISGYVVTLSLVRLLPPLEGAASFPEALRRASEGLRTFYARRFFRILPGALAVVLLDRVLFGQLPEQLGTIDQWQHEAVGVFSGLYNYVFAYEPDYKLGVYWSLAVEEHFYLVLPLLFVAFRTPARRLGASVAVGCASIALRALTPFDGMPVHDYDKFASHLRFDSLMAGVVLALLVNASRASPAAGDGAASPVRAARGGPLLRFAVVPALLALIACLPTVAPDDVTHHQGFIALWVMSGVLVLRAGRDQGDVLAFPVVGRVLEWVGSRSYALYLLHDPSAWIEEGARKSWPRYAELVACDDPQGRWKQALVMFALAFLLAELLHRLVERPCIALGRHLVDRARRAAVPAPA